MLLGNTEWLGKYSGMILDRYTPISGTRVKKSLELIPQLELINRQIKIFQVIQLSTAKDFLQQCCEFLLSGQSCCLSVFIFTLIWLFMWDHQFELNMINPQTELSRKSTSACQQSVVSRSQLPLLVTVHLCLSVANTTRLTRKYKITSWDYIYMCSC